MATSETAIKPVQTGRPQPLTGAFGGLAAFLAVYCARPEDWIPGLSGAPLAKITGILALLALMFSLRQIPSSLPREVVYLILLVGQLFVAAAMSPVWRGGALERTLDFAKVPIIVIGMAVAVNTAKQLRRLILIQAASVAVIASVAVWKGRLLLGRLEGVLNGNYSNPNELSLAIVIALPLCLVLLFLSRSRLRKAAWALAMLVMTYSVFLTASRGGFVSLIAATVVCLWEFAIRGVRRHLLVVVALVGVILWQSSGVMLRERLKGIFEPRENVASAYGSAQARRDLFWRSVEITKEHPLFGVGPGNFQVISGSWHDSHNSFTEMSSEGGMPAFILYVLILWQGFRNVRATKRWTRRQRVPNLLARGLHASLAGYAVGSLFDAAAYQFFPYFLVAYTTALFLIAKKSAAHSKDPESVSQAGPETQLYADTTETQMSWHSF